MIVISGAFVGVIFVAPIQLGVFIPWFIIGLIFLSALFVGGNVWKAYITSKYFKPEILSLSSKKGVFKNGKGIFQDTASLKF